MAYAVAQFDATDEAGNLLDHVTVEVRRETGGAQIVFADRDGTVPLGSQFVSETGHIRFFAPGNAYRIRMTKAGYQKELRFFPIGLASESDMVIRNFRGDWNAADTYRTFEMVTFNGLGFFVSTMEENQGHQPNAAGPASTPYWTYWAQEAPTGWMSVAEFQVTGGTANDITGIVAGGIDPAAIVMYVIKPAQTNTGAVKVNGIDLLAYDGTALAAGYLQAGAPVLFKPSGAAYRLVMDHRFQALADRAKAEADEAEYWAGLAQQAALPDGIITAAKVSNDAAQQIAIRQKIGAISSADVTPLISGLYTNVSMLALEVADLKGLRLGMRGGFADAFDDETGVVLPVYGGNDPYAKLLLKFEGANGSTNFVDSSYIASAMSVPTAGPAITTADYKFGASSVRFNGNGYVERANTADVRLGSADFTIDFWMNPVALGGAQGLVSQRISNTQYGPFLILLNGGAINVYATTADGAWNILSAWGAAYTVSNGVRSHFALVRYNNNYMLFKDGTKLVETTGLGAHSLLENGSPWRVGGEPGGGSASYNGYMDEFRLSVGIARWTANFVPPTSEYTGLITPGSTNQVYDPGLDLYYPSTSPGVIVPAATGTPIGNILSGGGPAASFNGVTSSVFGNNAQTTYQAASNAGFNNMVGKDWGAGNTRNIGRFRAFASTDYGVLGTAGGAPVKLQGSNDNAAWVDLYTSPGNVLTGGGQILDVSSGIVPGNYRYHRLNFNGNAGGSFGLIEIEFYSVGIVNNMTLYSVPLTAQTQPATGRLVLQIDTALAIVPNTDFSGSLSRNGGANFTVGNLSLVASNGTIKTYEAIIDLSGQPAGTSVVWQFKTLTNKLIPLSGVVVQWSP